MRLQDLVELRGYLTGSAYRSTWADAGCFGISIQLRRIRTSIIGSHGIGGSHPRCGFAQLEGSSGIGRIIRGSKIAWKNCRGTPPNQPEYRLAKPIDAGRSKAQKSLFLEAFSGNLFPTGGKSPPGQIGEAEAKMKVALDVSQTCVEVGGMWLGSLSNSPGAIGKSQPRPRNHSLSSLRDMGQQVIPTRDISRTAHS